MTSVNSNELCLNAILVIGEDCILMTLLTNLTITGKIQYTFLNDEINNLIFLDKLSSKKTVILRSIEH